MRNLELCRLARLPRPTTIAGVVERLLAIEDALPPTHGVAAFNRLYRWTTQNVGAAVDAGRFEAPEAMIALDVHFADLYFDAVDAWALGGPIPTAWSPLLSRGDDPEISGLRFALAGMHAHISRDLPVAVASLHGEPPEEDTPRFRDYVLVNRVLEETSETIRHLILPPLLNRIDAHLGELDNHVVIGSISAARRAAWEAAQVLWAVRERRWAWDLGVGCLDTAVGASAAVLLLEPHSPFEATYTPALRLAVAER
ncbi:MAG: DUF5995 family protein [Pseudomonadota bacterium]|nr:DUF5995 family protein [Pseudomonadota bacterium]